jgi:hypothetical protein
MNFSDLHRQMAASKLQLITEQQAAYPFLKYHQTKADSLQFTLAAFKDLAVMLDFEIEGAVIAAPESATFSNSICNMHYALIMNNQADFIENFRAALAILRKHFWQLQNEMAEI